VFAGSLLCVSIRLGWAGLCWASSPHRPSVQNRLLT
jgi:hypothetical protein